MSVGAAVLVAAIGVVSCATNTAPEPAPDPKRPQAQLGEPLTLRAGGTVAISNTSLVLTFERVTEDSRCPTNVNCIWAGNAIVRLAIQVAGTTRSPIELHTTTAPNREATVDGFRVRLVQLAPARTDGSTITQDQYIATLTVVRS